jgi:1,4-dihydroxy-2-naphthoate octaprenyltransferase
MPVFWFALSQIISINWVNTGMAFFILHFLVYPASNGYNSYMDRDTGSIGGIENPLEPTKELYGVTIIMNVLAILLGLIISKLFAACIALYILFSVLYSYRKIRLKQYPFLGYAVVIIFQGAFTFYMVKHGCSNSQSLLVSPIGMIAASLLIGSFYPLTQIYQHQQDAVDGVRTISAVLGYRGTFVFCSAVMFLASIFLAFYFALNLELDLFILTQIIMSPILLYFLWWMKKVWKDTANANFKNTMKMNVVASICSNAAFITILLINQL